MSERKTRAATDTSERKKGKGGERRRRRESTRGAKLIERWSRHATRGSVEELETPKMNACTRNTQLALTSSG